MSQQTSFINPSIFRAYDIRGVVGDTLTAAGLYDIGRVVGTLTLESGDKSIALARDARLSSPELFTALSTGIMSSGCDVLNIGVVPTPLLYYAANIFDTRSGAMLTGSHNPPEYNGVKIVINGKTLSDNAIREIYERILSNRFLSGKGEMRELDITERYLSRITTTVKLDRPLRVVVDCGNGVPALIAPELYRRMGCEVHELFCEVDGTFPNHHPDPSQIENLLDLINKVREVNADIGLAFDGDGDRLGVVTNKGEAIWPDRQMMVFAKSILSRNPGATIIYDVKCSSHLGTLIKTHGGVPIMWKTGHSLIKAKLAETNALLAGEMSGHIFLKDRWYGFDDAIYAGARMLEILAAQTQDMHAFFADIPNSINTPELKIYVSETEKFSLMNKLIAKADFNSAQEVMTIDGLRVNFADGWGLVRPSNTTPCLVLRFEAESESVLARIQKLFRDFILTVEPGLELPF
jgi:phosphomannomutase/phosphoglucomutase